MKTKRAKAKTATTPSSLGEAALAAMPATKTEKPIREPRQHSTLFSTIYEGDDYTIIRCPEWFDVQLERLTVANVHDLAVKWDEDHDERIFEAVEKLYMAGLLAPVQVIGEHKGTLTVEVAPKFYNTADVADYTRRLHRHRQLRWGGAQSMAKDDRDVWSVELDVFTRRQQDNHHHDGRQWFLAEQVQDTRVLTYLRSLEPLWDVGARRYLYGRPSTTLVRSGR